MSAQISNGSAKKRFLWASAGSLVIVISSLICTKPTYGQGLDTAGIIAVLESIQQVVTGTITPILNSVNTVTASMAKFQQTIMYPQSQIMANQAMAASAVNTMTSMNTMMTSRVNSATLPASQTLESQLLSGNSNNVSNIGSSYYSVYGTLPSSTALTSDMRSAVDMTDAQAQDALKTAVKLDAIAKTETTLSQQYMQQLASTAPGIASTVESHAEAWNLEAAAYTQEGLAELLRTQASDTAYQSFLIKHANTTHQQGLQQLGIPSN